ncbi:MAG: glycosyltransferase family 4 protein [Caldilineaceae bacterium]
MKIGYLMQAGVVDLFTQPPSGPALHVTHVITELTRLGHEVVLLLCWEGQLWQSVDLVHFQPIPIHWLDQGVLRLGERLIRRIQANLKLPYAAFFESVRFSAACTQTLADCDLLFERMGWVGYGGALAAHWLKIPLILEINGDHQQELAQLGLAPVGFQQWLSRRLTHWGVRQAAHTVATGEGWRQRFGERWQVDCAAISVVENGSELVNCLTRGQLRSFTPPSATDRAVTLVYVGGFEPWHGLAVLLRAVATAVAQGVTLRLLLIGGGSEETKLRQEVSALGLTEVVTFTGYLPMRELAGYLANADIGLCPYCGRVEYSGLKLLDYKAAGLVTIASGAGGQPAVLAHGCTGWIVPPCDEEALATAILTLSRDSEKRKAIGRAARLEAEQQHSWRHTAQQLEEIFINVVQRGVYG